MRASFSKTQIAVPCSVCWFVFPWIPYRVYYRWVTAVSNDLTFLEPKSEQLFLFCIRLLNKSRRNTGKTNENTDHSWWEVSQNLELTTLIFWLKKLISPIDQRPAPGHTTQDANPQILISTAVNSVTTLLVMEIANEQKWEIQIAESLEFFSQNPNV